MFFEKQLILKKSAFERHLGPIWAPHSLDPRCLDLVCLDPGCLDAVGLDPVCLDLN